MTVALESARRNHILNSLSPQEFSRLSPSLSETSLKQGEILYQPEQRIENVYFPIDSVVSIIGTTAEGHCTEVGIVGNHGLGGLYALLGAEWSPNEHMVLLAGRMIVGKAAAVTEEFRHCGSLHSAVLDFIRRFMAQVSQNAVCNRLHSLDQRFAKWLLMCDDRSNDRGLRLTQEVLAMMSGSTRASITVSALALRSEGVIDYQRRCITIVDRKALEDLSCECYAAVRQIYDE